MNPWLLDEDSAQAASWLCDAHVVHAPEEMAALLGTVWQWYVKHPPHTPHNWPADRPFLLPSLDLELPMVHWAMRNASNYMWLATYAARACEEYHARFGKRPLYAATCGVLNKPPYALAKGARQDFPYPVEVYRVAYAMSSLQWRYTPEPPWLNDYRR